MIDEDYSKGGGQKTHDFLGQTVYLCSDIACTMHGVCKQTHTVLGL